MLIHKNESKSVISYLEIRDKNGVINFKGEPKDVYKQMKNNK